MLYFKLYVFMTFNDNFVNDLKLGLRTKSAIARKPLELSKCHLADIEPDRIC